MRRPTEEILARLTIRAWCAGTLLERTDAEIQKAEWRGDGRWQRASRTSRDSRCEASVDR